LAGTHGKPLSRLRSLRQSQRPSDRQNDWSTNLCADSLDNPSEARITRHISADTQLPWYKFAEVQFAKDLPKFAEKDFDAMMKSIKLD
jgi:hypothetical protein